MLKTGKAKYDIFRTYYWHNAELVGKYKMPQLDANQATPFNVISFNERTGIAHPEEHWVDFLLLPQIILCIQNYFLHSVFGTVRAIVYLHIIFNRMDLMSFLSHLGVWKKISNGALTDYQLIVLSQLLLTVVNLVHTPKRFSLKALKN